MNDVLLVEGRDDFHVVSGLLKHHDFPKCFEVSPKNGIENLLSVIPVQLKATGVKRIGVVVDADFAISDRWNKIKSILQKAGYKNVPDSPDPLGTVIEEDDLPRFGIWLMPDNNVSGMLEDFVAYLIPNNDGLLPIVHQSILSIPENEIRFIKNHKSKVIIHTWLAWQADPGTPLGQSITKKYLDPQCSHAIKFINWLESLFLK